MRRIGMSVAGAMLAGAVVAALAPQAGAAGAAGAAPEPPLWLTHVQKFSGGISGGVRAHVQPAFVAARTTAAGPVAPAFRSGGNVQMNSQDSNPPLPQNETAVAASLDDPNVAVAAANDYVNGGVVVMRTLNGGRDWATSYVVPVFSVTRDACSGGDPSVAYSKRDHVFLLSQLCFFRTSPASEVQVFASTDNGLRWTPGRESAVAATNVSETTGHIKKAIFNDKEMIAVDNSPTSPHYGRLYVTYTKFHMLPDGSSDYCPLQLSYTDGVNTTNPSLTAFAHQQIQPDNPNGGGVGRSGNQFSYPVVEPDGTLDVGFVQEECNNSYDPHLLFQRSKDGGQSFLPEAVQIDKPGQYKDFLDAARDDTLPPTAFRAPNTISMAYAAGKLTYVYQNNIDRPQSKANISLQQSADGGLTWGDMRWLSTGTGGAPARNDQFFPSVAAGGGDSLVAIWLDRRLDPANHDIDTFEARSRDNGATWTNSRISTKSWNPDRGFFTSGAFVGDYIQVAASPSYFFPVWTDGRNSAINRTGIGETDIFTDVEPRG